MTVVTQLSPHTKLVSLPFQGEQGIIGTYVITGEDEVALIDPGPGSTYEDLLAALQESGIALEKVTHILATHVHLDHTGATGTLLHHLPNANVYVHSKGAPHLLDTTKLVASAQRIYGERMQQLWGDIESVPSERLHTLDDGDVLNVSGRRLEVHYTPGHAIHHIIFFDAHSGELFAGDVAGVRLQDIEYVRPPTPPPDLDLEAWFASIDKIRQLHPDTLYLSHFGPTRHSAQHFSRLREKLVTWGNFVLQAMNDGKNEAEIIDLLIAHTEPELRNFTSNEHDLVRYEIATNYPMTVQGYMRYWRKKHPELLH